ncbi:MAG: type VI secretion system tip protein VgrG, partial [Phycisphaerales bacterium]|nr:type VI secretion system tip protein VgrG [Phycisphaerales bacterium]
MADEFIQVPGDIDVEGDAFRLLSVVAREALSEVPSWVANVTSMDVVTTGTVPDPVTVIGKKAKIKLAREDGSQERELVGVVVEASRFADADGKPFLRLRISPRLWKLGQRADVRTFQEESVPDIVQKVLEGAGATDIEKMLSESYDPRVYCVQHRESDLDFVLRLLSEEGIWLAIQHADGTDKVVLGDDPTGMGPIDGESTLTFRHTFGFSGTNKNAVMGVRQALSVRSDKVMIRDYDFERPKLSLESKVEGKDDGDHALEVYVYPGRFIDQAVGDRYAQVLLDSIQAERDLVAGETTVLSMSPGKRFEITDHPYEPLNQEYLVTALETEMHDQTASGNEKGNQGANYRCRFTAVPTAKTAYRPPRRPRAAVVAGAETAVTTGPSGQEIHSDKHGRVKAKYHWDRLGAEDDTSSLWMRTSQVPLGGSMLLPRVGWEVGVRHVEGDPDVPIVMNRLYNAVKPPPYALPAGKARGALQTATTPGGGSSNEFRMDDTKGKEEFMINASKDMTIDVVNNTTEDIGNNETVSIGSNQSYNITNSYSETVGSNQSISVGGSQTLHVKMCMVDDVGGDHTHTIGGSRDMKIGGDHRITVGGSSSLDVGSNGIDLVVGSFNDTVGGSMTHKVGTALAEITTGDKSVVVGGSRTENAAAAKAVISLGHRGVEVGGSMTQKVAGAVLTMIKG